ncbi:hypothetical protein L0Y49_03045 [bacterium]|nr:hypothetical protein [bacterium]MCI0680153.1 hypothetical protein [bacterium]
MATQDVSSLFGGAVADGNISQATLSAINVPDLGAQIQAGLGVEVDQVMATSEVTLVTMMPDDSGSIRMAGNSQIMREGHNLVLDALMETKKAQREGIFIHTRYLNGIVLNPYVSLDQAVRMDNHNYNPNQGTPLYDQTVVLLMTVIKKVQEFSDSGVPCRAITLIITDGDDIHSRHQTPASVKQIVHDMLRTENHIIAFMGIDDGQTDFRMIAESMGILPDWVLTPKNTNSEIRAKWQMFSQSAVRASQGAASFSQTVVGGFGS